MSSEFEVCSRHAIAPSDWDALAEGSDAAWLWHHWRLCEALETWTNVSDLSFALRSPEGELTAVVPLRRTSFSRGRRLKFSRLDSLGGPAPAADLDEKVRDEAQAFALRHILRLAASTGDVETGVALPALAPHFRGDQPPKVNPLLRFGFDDASSQTWIIDLQPGKDQVWGGLKRRARQAIRKAEKLGVVVRQAGSETDLEHYYGMHTETYERTGVNPHPRVYFESIWSNFLSSDKAVAFFAELDGAPIGAQTFGVDKGAAIYWTGASKHEALDSGANYLLQWRAMEWMLDNDLRWCENGEAFPGARDAKAAGLSMFKESFGGDLYPYFRGRCKSPTRLYLALEGLKQIRTAIRR